MPKSGKLNLTFEPDDFGEKETTRNAVCADKHQAICRKLKPINSSREPSQDIYKVKNDCDENIKKIEKNNQVVNEGSKPVGFFQLFRFAGTVEKLLMFIASVGALAAGSLQPLVFVIFGRVAEEFIQETKWNETTVGSDVSMSHETHIPELAIQFCYVGLVMWVAMYLGLALWKMAAERQILLIRTLFFESVLRQEMAWFDKQPMKKLAPQMSGDFQKIGQAIGEKMFSVVFWVTMFIAGSLMALVQSWKLALAVMSVSPFLIIISRSIGKTIKFFIIKEAKAYAKAGSIAKEILASMETVLAFNGQQKELDRYTSNLTEVARLSFRKSVVLGLTTGSIWFLIYGSFSIAFVYGIRLYVNSEIHPGVALQVFYGVSTGSIALGHALSLIDIFAMSRVAAGKIYGIIDRSSAIDSLSDEGVRLQKIKGKLSVQGLHFAYPSRPDCKVLSGFELEVREGTTVALVGQSGSGKSTLFHLLQRFYDPQQGQILIDGVDIRGMHVGWLRKNIGIVRQEPVLFAATIYQNICYGFEQATKQEVEAAAKIANAHDFIMQLPLKYDTLLGESCSQLSGGQKQRIAIARALVGNPKILLLDEATSALDTQSEYLVQTALDKAKEGRTTLIAAHRLSTIIDADTICVMQNGAIVENGSHKELMSVEGCYYKLYQDVQEKDKTNDTDLEKGERILIDKLQKKDIIVTDTVPGDGTMTKQRVPSDASDKQTNWYFIRRLMMMNSPEWHLNLLGFISAALVGAIHPLFAILFSELLKVFAFDDPGKQIKQSYILGGMMVGLGAAVWIFTVIQSSCFGRSGVKLTTRLRKEIFKSMLWQDMAFFNEPKHQVSSLTSVLEYEASSVEKVTGSQIGNLVESGSRIVSALIIALYFGWKLSIVVGAFVPFILLSSFIQAKLLNPFIIKERDTELSASKVSSETLDNIRTVASLGKEKYFLGKYLSYYQTLTQYSKKKAHVQGIVYGFTQGAVLYCSYAAAFGYGSYLVEQGEMEFFNVFRVFAALVYTANAVNKANSFAPDFKTATKSAQKLFSILDRKPAISMDKNPGRILDNCLGGLRFQSISFRYPSRPDVKVLHDFNLEIKPGETLALIGASGGGKTTALRLLQRHYDPDHGSVLLDGHNIAQLDLSWLRSQFGVVSQEPVLFDKDIRENISYGDNSRAVGMADIIESARMANIHRFVEKLPMGYNTPVGLKASQLSGGQKQRIAIARALLRNPKILILDEATSALDNENEKLVQSALMEARKGRTCIIIAHRLSTIKSADRIVVLQEGRILAQGSYENLRNQGFIKDY